MDRHSKLYWRILMNVRYIDNKNIIGSSERFNQAGIGEVIVIFPDLDCTTELIKDLEVQLSDGSWHNMSEALFKNHLLIKDNYNIYFSEPRNDLDKEKGYYD